MERITVGHHFDSPAARADSRINITDNYLFPADDAGKVVAVMCVSPLAGLPSPYHGATQWETFRPETAYELRFDTDRDLRVDVVFRFVFDGDSRPQRWELRHLTGDEAQNREADGRLLGAGQTDETTELAGGGRVWIGPAGDPFWLDAVAAQQFIAGLVGGGPWEPDRFSSGNPTTGATNVIAIVAELPLPLIAAGPFAFWTTVAANDHHHWTQVNRCGRPNFAATFNDAPEGSALYNATDPDTDLANFGAVVRETTARIVAAAGTAPDPNGYGELVARQLLPDVIPFDPALAASFGFAGVNGRGLADDFGAVVYSSVFNHPMRTALAPLPDLRREWPYLPPSRPLPSGSDLAVPTRQEL